MNFSAVILAGSAGSRLHPLTCAEDAFNSDCEDDSAETDPSGPPAANTPIPKFLLPIAGRTPLEFLLKAVHMAGVAPNNTLLVASPDLANVINPFLATSNNAAIMALKIMYLTPKAGGSADALREVKEANKIPASHHVLLFSADLILESPSGIASLAAHHTLACTQPDPTSDFAMNATNGAITMLLADVGVEDDEHKPVKESKKGKMGLLQRETDDVEIIACAVPHRDLPATCTHPVPRVLLKQSKVEVDESEENVGDTPKLPLPKQLIREACTPLTALAVRTDLMDLHAYAVAPWVWGELLGAKASEGMASVQTEVLQHLIAHQTRGLHSAFRLPPAQFASTYAESLSPAAIPSSTYTVNAFILPRSPALALRICSLPNYLFACREAVTHAIRPKTDAPTVWGRLEGTVHAKDNSLLGDDVTKGSGGKIQNTTIGAGVNIGSKCKINNCIIFDNVVIGNGCVLQNSIVCKGAVLEENCNLNDVQVNYGVTVKGGTKVKGEVIE